MTKNKKIIITGGAGFLGKNLIKKLYDTNEITVYSRDEAKHYFLKKQYPKIRCVVGDIADLDLLNRACKGQNIGIFAASLKQIEAVDENYEVAVKTIINGGLNSRRCAEENLFESACFISSDKSRSATTLYGSMKFVAGESFIVNSNNSNTNLNTVIYGNVTNSTGSVIPLIWESINNGRTLQLYSEKMTRFMLTIDDAVEIIDYSLTSNISGFNIIPIIKSFKIKDLFEIYTENFNLKFIISTPRVSEKIHEIMISSEEIPRVTKLGDSKYYHMHYKNIYNELSFSNNEYSSKDVLITKDDLYEYLNNYNFFK